MSISKLKLPEERERLEIKVIANEARSNFNNRGITDVFEMLEEKAMLIRLPLNVYDLSGFSTYYDGEFVVVLNTSFTLGHERYTAAHELYHLLYNQDILKKEKVMLREEKYEIEDKKADVFASELLMPEDYVKELFYRLVNVEKNKVKARHIVRLNSTLKVSYKAMLKRLVQLDLCDISLYDALAEYGSLEMKEELRSITKIEGYDISLIVPSNSHYISKEYLELVKNNFEQGIISYGKLEQLLEFINQNPSDYGYSRE